MDWLQFEDILLKKHIYTINNNSSKNIVLFGSCHMATIGFMLNKLLNYEYNIHIIISWFFQNKGIEKFDMCDINSRIHRLVSSADVFINHAHINDYDVNATKLPSIVKDNCLKLVVPNYRLDYTSTTNFFDSLNILKFHIESSNFPEIKFITDYYKDIIFFNTTNHPTHYVLFLQSQFIINKILNNGQLITIENYHDKNNRAHFKQFSYVTLPGKENLNKETSQYSGISMNADYFD
jgi:hypothetical protein